MKKVIFVSVLFVMCMGLFVKAEADNDVSFTIRPNSTLLVNGGTMEDADIKAQTGSNVKIQNNGRIIPRTNRDFYIPIGAKMQINYGRIK